MPQLNPKPWLMVFLTTWFMLIIATHPKIASLKFMNNPAPFHPTPIKPWPWPQI
ncbi:ATP synthase F0 subunit 8 (mitochondrion) [Gavialis gangeticus]|uniref:ATP synthase complex subunit 8 n=1 Tax=Gavialis gangeticus TaxID=94835 RepID=Q335S6_GAVGA|nr:ATP synthase F0 subunit 8 [Gavialis gangeticus]BAE97408.1 ATPase subunit 8 [Gavialis gangeticus]CAH18621.1 ATP synthase F0 subunit 8 [Gavialis gangeticus]